MSSRRRRRNVFCQKSPPFLTYLKNILHKYPDGGQILKELIQNADDAGAREVIFLHDERAYGTENLYSEDLQNFQGPALLAYNDALFSPEDWKGIQSTGNSVKLKDPNTVGRFGLGFNSVYHITDLPSVLSGQEVGMLDPQKIAFDEGGFKWSLEYPEDKQEVEAYADQFQPIWNALEAIDRGSWATIARGNRFPGTLFRFPLRKIASEISDNLYTTERIQELFDSFSGDASISLLFLRNVTKVSLKTVGQDGIVKHLLTASTTIQDNETLTQTNSSCAAQILTSRCLKVISLQRSGKDDPGCQWLVTTSIVKEASFPDLEDLAKKLSNRPTMALAYPFTSERGDTCEGRLSCFLPLPDKEENRTGLPVHVNATFDLTDDRRSMKWVEVDQQHDEAARWNQLLVEEVLPLVYCHAIQAAVDFVRSCRMSATAAYGIWPDPLKTRHKEKWNNLIKKVSQKLLELDVLCLASDSSRWLKPSEVVFLPSMEDQNLKNTLEELLLSVGESLVRVPENVQRTLQLSPNSLALKTVSPSFIRGVLRRGTWNNFSSQQKLQILEYITKDGQYQDLLGLQLFPLSDGTFTSFQTTDRDGVVYLDSPRFPRTLLPGLVQKFPPTDIKMEVMQLLQKIADSRIFRNIVCLDTAVIINSLRNALPESWLHSSGPVSWCPGEPRHPPRGWLHEFWNFLQQDAGHLTPFEGHPLVPLSPVDGGGRCVSLAQLTLKPSLLLQNQGGHSLTEDMAKVLERAGCTVIRQWDAKVWHRLLSNYVLAPSPNNILKAFVHLGVDKVLRCLAAMLAEHRKLLCDLLSQASAFNAEELQVLSQLPVFQKMPSLQCPGSELVAAASSPAVESNTIPPVPRDLVLPEKLLLCRDERDRRLMLQMRVQLLSASDVALLSVCALNKGLYAQEPNQADHLMLWVLRNGDLLFSQNTLLRKTCEDLKFLPSNGRLLQPSDFFDPKVKIFQDLFESESFPPQIYREESVLRSLRNLGLKVSIENMTPQDILKIAEVVNATQKAGDLSTVERKARALIRVCNETRVLSRFSQAGLEKLRSLAWVPRSSSTLELSFHQPQELRSTKHSSIVELAMPLTNAFNDEANDLLGLNGLPPPEKVVENLNSLSKIYQEKDAHVLLLNLHCIYKYVQDNLGQFSVLLKGIMIWNGDGFSNPSEILLSYPEDLDLSCLIKKVPQGFVIYRNLFLKCGVPETLSEADVAQLLNKMSRDIEGRSSTCGTEVELKLAVSILDWMKRKGHWHTDDLPIPVQAGNGKFILKPLSCTLFCDMPREHLKELCCDDECFCVVHEDISLALATFLEVPLLSTKVLKPEFFEPWGPSEPITLRIKNILREYSEQVDLFKEMIQNADDAGATICRFLVDWRQNLEFRTSLIDSGMTSCQGAALWSYNNRPFTEEDFHNITRVGAATKESQVEKIGKFGLGFNTVYHVTDAPCILSNGNLIFFDPNVSHLQKHIKSNATPGIKLNLQERARVLQLFPDQFHPYDNIFGCELKVPFNYDGTLIRLPFRTEEEAKTSMISSEIFSKQRVSALIDSFHESSHNLIIFLKNVQVVTLDCLPDDTSSSPGNLTSNLLEFQRETVQRLVIPQNFLLQDAEKAAADLIGRQNVIDITRSNIIKMTVGQNTKHYLLHSSFGTGKSLKMFQQNRQGKQTFAFPLAGVAIPLKRKDKGKWAPDLENFNGQAFCFLPLPIFTGLPLHLNASFSVMSNRKSLWDTTEKGVWNHALQCDAALVAWTRALAHLQIMDQEGELEDYNYYTFWPDINKVKSSFTEVVKAFYQAVANGLADGDLAFFSNGDEWCTVKHACFLASDITQHKQLAETATQVFSAMLQKPYLAVSLPDWVKASFHTSNCASVLLQNTYNWERFHRDIVFTNLGCLELNARNSLIIHALDMNNKEVDQLLKSVPCIPSTPAGKLQLIGKMIHPQGKVAALFEREEGRFPQGTQCDFLNPERLVRLELLGMLNDCIHMRELMERAHTIPMIWKYSREKAYLRIQHILNLLKDLIDQHYSNTDQADFRSISFLPAVLSKGKLEKGVGDVTLMKPTEIYHYKCLNLVDLSEPVLCKKLVGQNFKIASEVIWFLGLRCNPPTETVMLQLENAYRNSRSLSNQDLMQTVKKCYTYLNKMVEENPSEGLKIKSKALKFPFILVGKEFVEIDSVAHTLAFDAVPYLHRLPEEYQEFRKLWGCVELCEAFGFDDYVAALQKMEKKYKGKCLPRNELELAVALVNGLHGTCTKDPISVHEAQRIFLPGQDKILHHVDKLHYNDTPWITSDKETLFCHAMIPRAIAMKLRVPTKRHKMLQKLKVSELSQWVSNFGAKEDLTRRISNIISEYSSKRDILKELIQNADDSEATEIHFIWDNRTHPGKAVFGEEWEPLQGPALCIYNNKVFTHEDIEGIQQLGKGGKGEKFDKTGKYGLGFNVVYHLTDCPSFVTGDSMLCVFDPNLMFLSTSDDSSPGGMFSVNKEFKTSFRDVYSTYLPNLFNLEQGTLFRLPLRAATMAAKSKISQQMVSSEAIKELSEALEEDAESLILFLNSIQRITFSEISEGGQLQEILSVETKMSDKCLADRLDYQEKLCQFAAVDGSRTEILPYQVSYTMEVKCSNSRPVTHWILAKQIGVQGEEKVADFCKVSECLRQTRLPLGAIAACINKHIPGRAFCTLPLPAATGLPVYISGNFIVDSARRDICKEDGRSAKTEWNVLLLTHLLAPLYGDLLTRLLERLAPDLKKPLEFENFDICKNFLQSSYLRFFPCINKKLPLLWQKMVGQVYCSISEKLLPLIPVYKVETIKMHTYSKEILKVSWSPVAQEELTAQPHFILQDVHKEVLKVLQRLNMCLVPSLKDCYILFEEFSRMGVPVLEVNPETVCNFLKVCSLYPEGLGLPMPISETLLNDQSSCSSLLNFCLQEGKAGCLSGLPLMVTQDGVLRTFSCDDPKYYSKFGDLFPAHEDCFASETVINAKHNKVLQKMGFLKDFSIQESIFYIKEQLEQRSWNSPGKVGVSLKLSQQDKKWLTRLWEFFKSKIDPEDEQMTDQFITLFSDCSLLPVYYCGPTDGLFLMPLGSTDNLFLMPLGSRKNIIYELSDDISKILGKLGFAILKSIILPFDLHYHFIRKQLLQTNNCSEVLEQLCARTGLQWAKLCDWDIDRMLRFILERIHNVTDKNMVLTNLKALPLFKAIQGSSVCLNMYHKIYILDTKLSENILNFKELYSLDDQTVFLRNSSINKELKEILNIQVINDVEFFIKFVLPRLLHLNEAQLLKVLQLLESIIRNCCTVYLLEKDTIIASLKPIKFIRDCKGELQQASYYYDSNVEIFKTLGLQARFIPVRFFEDLGLDHFRLEGLLRDLGMKYKVSDEDFVKFATQIEREASQGISVVQLAPKINVLFIHLLSLKEKDLHDSFISTVRGIKFLAPLEVECDLQSLHPSRAKPETLVSLKGSLMQKHFDTVQLVWTSMAILPNHSTLSLKNREVLEKFGVLFEAPTTMVLENIKNVCRALCSSPDLVKIRSQVLQTTYDFLQKDLSFDVSSLTSLPIILVEDYALAESNQVVFSLMEDNVFSPYLYKLPSLLACYSKLFQKLGVEASPTVLHYARVLSTIYWDTKEKKELHANLKRTVSVATRQLFCLIIEKKQNDFKDLKTLYLPATDGKLYESSALVFNDRICSIAMAKLDGIFKFLSIIHAYHRFGDLYLYRKVLQCLPEDMRPKFLSEITEQSIEDQSLKPCVDGANCELKCQLQDLLSSSSFKEGLVCLLRGQTKGEMSEEKATEECSAVFGKLEIICSPRVQTVLLYESRPLPGTYFRRDVFIKKGSNGQCQVYLKHKHKMSCREAVTVISTLAEEINGIMKNLLIQSSIKVLVEMLACESPEEIDSILQSHEIFIKGSTGLDAYSLPNAGEEIPQEWHDCLDMSFLNTFKENDYVGYLDPSKEELYLYAIIVEQLKPKVSGSGQVQMYRISLGPDRFEDVSNLDLYQFKRSSNSSSKERALVLVENQKEQQAIQDQWFEKSLGAIKEEIDGQLCEIWKLSPEERKKAVRRLYLRYHPDKNIGQEKLAEEICKYLQQRIKELEDGGYRNQPNHNGKQYSPSHGFSHCWNGWSREASRHRANRDRFSANQNFPYDFWSYHRRQSRRKERPNPTEAKRWLKQALCDLCAAAHDVGVDSTEWVFHKAHQAVEKALIAAHFSRYGWFENGSSIICLARDVSGFSHHLQNITKQVKQLQQYGVDDKKTQYPTYHSPPNIPNNSFPADKEVEVLQLAQKILDAVEEYIH
ncbi:sacsin-like [Microcaecilia unicolor]|uniref:Sacsin-like n=1 Tax=Microcaecilia unicolor TaxID=1415580 RepID=A0A6P7XM31_9AMPH|nr:sacsin-like [Microcaecilia unicolor]